MASWGELGRARPDLSEGGTSLLYQHGVGLAFLATVRPSGGPRLHPVCPLLADDAMYGFIIPSPKQQDLLRDGRYALHSFPTPNNEDAFYLTGQAHAIEGGDLRDRLGRQFVEERAQFHVPTPAGTDILFVFDIDSCLLTRTSGFGDQDPQHLVWRDQDAAPSAEA